MPETPDPHDDGQPLSERVLDLLVFLPTGLVVTLAEELPRLAERGRERLGVQVNSARAVGHFAVRAGGHELRRRSDRLKRPPATTGGDGTSGAEPSPRPTGASASAGGGTTRLRSIPRPPTGPAAERGPTAPAPSVTPAAATPSAAPSVTPPTAAARVATAAPATGPAPVRTPAPARTNVPDVTSLAIPGFDTLSASQVVQRLDGLNRPELVSVRAYETSTRGRRTILSRVDQLLDERS
jgi:hypothetical protein